MPYRTEMVSGGGYYLSQSTVNMKLKKYKDGLIAIFVFFTIYKLAYVLI